MNYPIPRDRTEMEKVVSHMTLQRIELDKQRKRDTPRMSLFESNSPNPFAHDKKAEEIACYIKAYFEAMEEIEKEI